MTVEGDSFLKMIGPDLYIFFLGIIFTLTSSFFSWKDNALIHIFQSIAKGENLPNLGVCH